MPFAASTCNHAALNRGTTTLIGLRADVADILTARVRGMNPDNSLVRPHRPWVEKYAEREAYLVLLLKIGVPSNRLKDIMYSDPYLSYAAERSARHFSGTAG